MANHLPDLREGEERLKGLVGDILAEAKKQDAASVEVFKEAGVEIAQMSAEDFDAWRAIAKETSYKAFLEEVPDGQELLDLAFAVE